MLLRLDPGPFVLPDEVRRRIMVVPAPPDVGLKSDCWICVAGRFSRNGYGRMYLGRGIEVQLHRWLFVRMRDPIPDDALLDHLCRRRACVNPWHLDPVSHSVNTRRGNAVLFTAVNAREELPT